MSTGDVSWESQGEAACLYLEDEGNVGGDLENIRVSPLSFRCILLTYRDTHVLGVWPSCTRFQQEQLQTVSITSSSIPW